MTGHRFRIDWAEFRQKLSRKTLENSMCIIFGFREKSLHHTMCYLKKWLSKKWLAQRLHNTTLCKERVASVLGQCSRPSQNSTVFHGIPFFLMILWYMGPRETIGFPSSRRGWGRSPTRNINKSLIFCVFRAGGGCCHHAAKSLKSY